MRIGLIADTQVPSADLSPNVKKAFDGVDMILHAGDIIIPRCLDMLEEIAPVTAIEGSMYAQFENDNRVVQGKRVVEVDGHKIGMVHELSIPGASAMEVLEGTIEKAFPKGLSISDCMETLFGEKVDIVHFGMSHETMVEEHEGILFVNPGSPTWPHNKVMLGTVAILDLANGREVEIIELSKFD
ncbi:metallophosphatase family protein [Dehalococcoidia bacterium]|nr:metallophosphatase family protein [Dehalococcoidia bacterium]